MLRASLRSSVRSFHSNRVYNAATIFRMPAMSPTMTEGGIVAWKLKSGDKFAAGDVLVEVETDKATIDVEAQDDGVMWDILKNDGDKAIPVGQPIAYLAEEGDDLSSLEKPKDDQAAAPKEEPKKEEPKKEEPKKEEPKKKEESKPASSSSSSSSSVFSAANPKQKFSPAVELLLHEHEISNEDALSKIQASGPKGRILKGDVLAYIGEIKLDAVSKIAEWIKSKEHLDLSNVVLAEKKPEPKKEDTKVAEEPAKPTDILDLSITVDLTQFDGLSGFKSYAPFLIKDATSLAYQRKFPQFSEGPTSIPSSGDLFDELVSPSVTESRFEVTNVKFDHWEEISDIPVKSVQSSQAPDDLFDEIIGSSPTSTSTPALAKSNSLVDLELTVKINEKLSDSKEFISYFEEALYELLEPVEKESV
ncbi:pyruvate dehydrogenase complex protein X component, mitochondrial [[Candida] railenensis]|uniref:Dihydrolipoamide dehydrogenase-binding protein of pyruvate dehydrogenase complex n=1 Tax=[Candida] railenensis TaxID=45579 RepID=A0A9P0VXK7_9ASCO|nr:pyruvate dehydrogenase complex protein X component, mitochondrial [[Candida] railenensis]